MNIKTEQIIKKAVSIIQAGGIVIYPTDTAFGIGCRIDDRKTIDRLFVMRHRPITQAVPVLVSSPEQALSYFDHASDVVRHLMDKYWPGALTIVMSCQKNLVYSPIRGGGETIGVRMPDCEITLNIIEGVGVPILGPSANFHGSSTPYQEEDLDPELIKLVDLVVPGECKLGNVSTVADCSVWPYRILRQGAVTIPTS